MDIEPANDILRQLEQSTYEITLLGRALAAKLQGSPQPLNIRYTRERAAAALTQCEALMGRLLDRAEHTSAQLQFPTL